MTARLFPAPGPHVLGLPPGVDFPALLVRGLHDRLAGQPAEAMAGVTLFVNTQRMRRRITDLMTASGAGFLPRIYLVTEAPVGLASLGVPAPVSPLRRRLELARLIAGLIEAQPGFAPRAAAFDLADSLASLMDEMQGEGVPPDRIAALDVSDHSAHWQRTQGFMAIIAPFFAADAPDAQSRLRRIVDRQAALWAENPPPGPVIVAGSTGSRGTTACLMRAVAGLPQGALILPGFDFDMPGEVWGSLADAMTAEDHPQYRFRRLLDDLGLDHGAVRPWVDAAPPDPARNRLISLSLRPAPVTDQWISDGPALGDLVAASQNMTLIEAPSPRAEAMAIALILRKAAEDGRRAALVTPDRGLTRQVTAALDRWGILPDDSAGQPLSQSAPGRLLRHTAGVFGERLDGETLISLLKHPLTATGWQRNLHLRLTRDLELHLRRHGPPFPDAAMLTAWAKAQKDAAAPPWAAWIAATLAGTETITMRPLPDHVSAHLALTEALAEGPAQGTAGGPQQGQSELWQQTAGAAALAAMQDLTEQAEHGGDCSAFDYRALVEAILSRGEVREDVQAHPGVMIWGTIEARVQGADLVVLAGLNEGVWPKAPPPDPWLNRQMRKQAGLLLPERRIGLSAHDYQQAVCGPEVVLSRASRDAEAETVSSRWVNRLINLMEGLPQQGGREALAAMRNRGQGWLRLAEAVGKPAVTVPPAPRPAPRPPVASRPDRLSVTGITRLIRDPYAVYARSVLRLYPLNPLRQGPEARLRGSILHEVLERYVRVRDETPPEAARDRLLSIAGGVLAEAAPWAAARALWLARLDRAADFFLAQDRSTGGAPVALEEEGRIALDHGRFTLTAKPDRIDMLPDGRLHILDYKTGTPPTDKQQKHFDKQLVLEAAMAERGAFAALGPREVARITYVGLGSKPEAKGQTIDAADLATIWQELHRLIDRYLSPEQGFVSRRAPLHEEEAGDYDHLARHGEWDQTSAPIPEDLS